MDAGRFDWKASGKFPQFAMPDASLPRTELRGCGGSGGLLGASPRHPAAGYGSLPFPLPRVFFLQGLETLSAAGGAPCENTQKSDRLSAKTAAGGTHQTIRLASADPKQRRLYETISQKAAALFLLSR